MKEFIVHFPFRHRQWVRHRLLPDLAGYVQDMSIDDAMTYWVKIAFVRDGEYRSEWLQSKDVEQFEPAVAGFGSV